MSEELRIVVSGDVDQARAALEGIAGTAEKTGQSFRLIIPAAAAASSSIDKIIPSAKNVEVSIKSVTQVIKDLSKQNIKIADIDEVKRLAAVMDSAGASSKQYKAALDTIALSAKNAGDSLSVLQRRVQLFGGGVTPFTQNGRSLIQPIPSNVPASFDKLKTSASAANIALINTGRVFQDLPFGIIGVANNINPLIESFQRLSATAKATGVSIGSALLTSLKGGGGLGIAFSLITAAATFAAVGLQAFTGRLNRTKKESEDTKTQLEKLKEAFKDLKSVSDIRIQSIGSVQGDITQVNALAEAIRDTNLSYFERKNALEALKATNKSYFGDITLETSSLEKLTQRVNEYTEALVAAAVVKGFENEISKVAPELGKLNKAFNDAGINVDKLRDKLKNLPKETQAQVLLPGGTAGAQVTQQLGEQSAAELKLADSINKELQKQKELGVELQKQRGNYADLQDAISGAVKETLKFKPLTDTTKDAQKGLTETQRKLIEVAKAAEELFKVPLELKFSIQDTSKQELEKARAIIEGIKDKTIRLRVIPPEDIKLPKLKFEIDKPEFKKSIDDLLLRDRAEIEAVLKTKTFNEQVEDLKKALKLELTIDPKNISASLSKAANQILTNKELEDALRLSLTLDIDPVKLATAVNNIKNFIPKSQIGKLDIALEVGDIKTIGLLQAVANMNEDITKAINDGLKNINVEGIAGIGEAIGAALSGSDIGSAFQQFASAIGSAVQALGKQIIALGVAALLAKKSLKVLFANPAVAIAAGIALVAIGAALKNLLGGGLQGFAKGGRPPLGKEVLVGERGPEIMRFDQPGTILSHSDSVKVLKERMSERNVVSSQSLKESDSIKEFFIATKLSQLVKEQFNTISSSIKESIRLIVSPIETKLSETVKNITTNNEKLTAYAYKLHELNSNTATSIQSLKESFVSDKTNSFEKLASSFKEFSDKERTTNSFEKIADSLRTFSDKIFKESIHSTDKSNILKTDFQKTFSDKNLVEKLTAYTYKLHEASKDSESESIYKTIYIEPKSFEDRIGTPIGVYEVFQKIIGEKTEINSKNSLDTSVIEKLTSSFKEATFTNSIEKFATQFKTIIASSFSNNILSKTLAEYEKQSLQNFRESKDFFRENKSLNTITDKVFIDSKLINVSDKLSELFKINESATSKFSADKTNSTASSFDSIIKTSSEKLISQFKTITNIISDSLESSNIILQGKETLSSVITNGFEKLNTSSKNTTDKVSTENKLVNVSKLFYEKLTLGEQSKSIENFYKEFITKQINSLSTINNLSENKESSSVLDRLIEKITFKEISKLKDTSHTEKQSFKQLELFTNNTERETNTVDFIEKFHTSFTRIERLFEKLNQSKSINIEKVINNTVLSKESSSLKSLSIDRIQKLFNIPAFAGGGAVFGPTLAILGEGFGISRSNPEFVGTAQQLKQIQGGSIGVDLNINGQLVARGSDLLAVISRSEKTQSRTT